ncbi:hypothetical protein BG011_009337 [Mortierella polycephala]|uniref:Uncharacterized protein n=1 Tax=Mortierella polycephala TaxID=41804 RepID=A0A9P6TWT7_9FUNG|nr:hypothetical protein BG011_009337 [Mortierella polycephala]
MEFPKINVSSKADIQFITQIWRKTLYDKLEQQYSDGNPQLMQQVQELLDQLMGVSPYPLTHEQWLENMVSMASTNIDINGIPYDEAIRNEDVEPLDESLGTRLQAQQLQVEELTLSVAERRKRVPEQVKMLLDDAIRRQSALADRIEFEPEEGNDTETLAAEEMDSVTLERPDLIAEEYTSSMALLSGLKKVGSIACILLLGALTRQ